MTAKRPTSAELSRREPFPQRPSTAASERSPHIRNSSAYPETKLGRPAREQPLLPSTRYRAPEPRAEPIRHGNIELRPEEYQLLIDGRRVALTIREFEVLLMLAGNEDRVVRRARIFEHVWGEQMKHRERAVDVFVRKLRIKLAKAAPSWVYIHTHFGIGYRFAPEERAAPADTH